MSGMLALTLRVLAVVGDPPDGDKGSLANIFTVQMHTDRSLARTRAALCICIINTTLASGPVNSFKNVNSLLFTLTQENIKCKYFLIKSFLFCFMNILFCYFLAHKDKITQKCQRDEYTDELILRSWSTRFTENARVEKEAYLDFKISIPHMYIE